MYENRGRGEGEGGREERPTDVESRRMHANTKRNWVELEKGEGRIKPIPRRLSQS